MIIQHKALGRVGEDSLSTWSINVAVTFEQDRASARCACFAVFVHERTSGRFTAAHHDLVFCSGGWFGAFVSISQANLRRVRMRTYHSHSRHLWTKSSSSNHYNRTCKIPRMENLPWSRIRLWRNSESVLLLWMK